MKKLNRKGFTLVELLAVIIILAIVVGITIPSITNIINGSKNSALEVACNSAADYLSDQYAMMNVSFNSASSNFSTAFSGKEGTVVELTGELLKEAGFNSKNVKEVLAQVELDGSVCVTVTKLDTTGEYYSTSYWTTEGTAKTGNDAPSNYSNGCNAPLTKQ